MDCSARSVRQRGFEVEYFIYIGTLICIYATLTISLNLLVGYTGLISIAQAAIYGVGAYTTALLALRGINDLLISIVCASIVGVLVSLVIALPSLRLKNEYFLIATMGFQAIIFSLFMNLEITGGASGLYGIPHPTLFGYTIRTSLEKFLLTLALAIICYGLALRITNAPFGRLLRAVREDQTAVASLGKSVFQIKFSVFIFSAVFAAAAGTLFVYSLTAIDPVAFGLDESIFIITLVIVGGTGSLNGSLLAAALLILLPETFKFLAIPEAIAPQLRQVLYGLLLVFFTRYRRQGLIGEYRDVLK
jgi:branched-chain amino acid transport system permease protein